jgi:hypothetical protein
MENFIIMSNKSIIDYYLLLKTHCEKPMMTLTSNNYSPTFELSGIRIYYGKIQEKPDGTLVCSHTFPEKIKVENNFCSDFYLLFQSILDELEEYIWLVDLECFNLQYLNENDFDTVESYLDSIRVDNIAYLSNSPGFLKQFAPLVKDDWNQLWGFKKTLLNVRTLINCYPITDISQNIPPEIDIIFNNYDGAYWELFTKDKSLIEMAKKSLYSKFTKVVPVRIVDTSLIKSFSI